MSFVGMLVIMLTSCVFRGGSASAKMDLFHIAKQAGKNKKQEGLREKSNREL
jgi:hypothetical protein